MRRVPWLPLLCLLLTSPAAANIAQSLPDPAVLGAPAAAPADASLRIDAEQLSFDCRHEGDLPVCRFEARYTFSNQADAARTAVAAFYGVHARDVRALQDGRSILHPLDAATLRALDGRVLHGAGAPALRKEALTRTGLRITVGGRRAAEVVVSGRILPGRYFRAGYDRSVPETRHLLLGGAVPRSQRFDLQYLVAPIRTWGPAPEIAVRLSYPARWRVALRCTGAGARQPRIDRRVDGSRVSERFRVAGQQTDALLLQIEAPRRLYNGGVLLGIGGNLDDSGGLRTRFGYEIALPEWLLWSLALDTNFRDDLVLAPGLELATRSYLGFIPSLGLGVGAPIRLAPERRAGVRAQLTVHWPLLGWVTCFDIYPGAGFSEPRRFQVAMLAQIGI